MASFDPLLLRFIERLAAVLLGGMAIYLGYRLFQLVPESKESSGRGGLPWNGTVGVSKGGPGDPGNRIDDRRLLKKEINILNAIPQRLRAELPAPDREEVEAAIPRI